MGGLTVFDVYTSPFANLLVTSVSRNGLPVYTYAKTAKKPA